MVSAVYSDQGPSVDGTALAANNLNSAVVAQGYLISGGLVEVGAGGSISIGGVGMDILQPQTEAVVARGDLTGYLLVPATIIALSADMDNYVDLILESGGAFYTGAYSVRAVAIGTDAPAQDGGTLRLYRATVVSLGLGTAQVSAVRQLATPLPVGQAQVTMDRVEVQTNDTVSYTGSLLSNLNRIRYQMGVMIGGAWTAAVQMIPLSLRGAANGVAELDSSARLPNGELPIDPVLVGDLAVGGHISQGIQGGYALSVGGSAYLTGDLGVVGGESVDFLSVHTTHRSPYEFNVLGDSYLDGNLAVINSQSIGGFLEIGSYLAINHSNTSGFYLDVGGKSVLHGDAYIEGTLYADTGIYGNTGTNILDIHGPTLINLWGPVATSSDLTVYANLGVTTGAFTVSSGVTTLAGHLQVNNTATVDSHVEVTHGNLNVADAGSSASFNGTVTATGHTQINNTATVTGLLTANHIDGSSNLVTFNHDVTVTDVLTVNSTTFLNGLLDVASISNGGSAPSVANGLDVSGTLTIELLGLTSGSGTPTFNNLASGCTAHVQRGNNAAGIIKYHQTGSGSSGLQFTVLYSASYGVQPIVLLTPIIFDTTYQPMYPGVSATTGFDVYFGFAPSAGADYYFSYVVIG